MLIKYTVIAAGTASEVLSGTAGLLSMPSKADVGTGSYTAVNEVKCGGGYIDGPCEMQ